MITKQEEYLADFESSIGTKYYELGEAKGIEIGEINATRKLAAKLLDQGLDPEMVSRVTGLHHDDLKASSAH